MSLRRVIFSVSSSLLLLSTLHLAHAIPFTQFETKALNLTVLNTFIRNSTAINTKFISTPNSSPVSSQAQWTHLCFFFLTKYLLHLATVRSRPGDTNRAFILDALLALFFPFSGAVRAVECILRAPIFQKNELKRIAKSETFCAVVRDKTWTPRKGDKVVVVDVRKWQEHEDPPVEDPDSPVRAVFHFCKIQSPSWTITSLSPLSPTAKSLHGPKRIHGIQYLPPGYELLILPSSVPVCLFPTPQSPNISKLSPQIPTTLPTIPILISLIHITTTLLTLSSLFTLNSTKHPHTITVLPYLLSTLLNLLSAMLHPTYPTLHLLSTPELHEAEKRGGIFTGIIGALNLDAVRALDLDTREYECVSTKTDNNPRGESVWRRPDLPHHHYIVRARFKGSSTQKGKGEDIDGRGEEEAELLVDACQRFIGEKETDGVGARRFWLAWFVAVVLVMPVPFVCLFLVEGFSLMEARSEERGWIVAWLVMGTVVGSLGPVFRRWRGSEWLDVGLVGVMGSTAIGAAVMVGRMVMEQE